MLLRQQGRLAAAPAQPAARYACWPLERSCLRCRQRRSLAAGALQRQEQQTAQPRCQQASAASLAVAAGMLGLALWTPMPAVADALDTGLPEPPQQVQTVASSSATSSTSVLSAIAPLAPAEAPALVSNSGDVLLEGFKGMVTEGLHDLTESSMTAVGGPVTGEVLSSGGSSTAAAAGSQATAVTALEAAAGGEQAAPPAAAAEPAAAAPGLPSPVLQAGRLGLLCGMWQAYCSALETSPLLTKIYTSIVGTLLGDLAAQLLSYQQQLSNRVAHRRSSSSGGSALPAFQFDAARCARLCLYSAVIGTPMGHYWYMALEQHVLPATPTAPAAVLAKVGLDQFFQTPFGMALFLGGMKLLEGRPREVGAELQAKMVPALLANWKLWPAAQLINFCFVPEQQRILYGNIVGICWTCIISNMQQASAATSSAHIAAGGAAASGESAAAAAGDASAQGAAQGVGRVAGALGGPAAAVPGPTGPMAARAKSRAALPA